jgi:hypothetical protein
VEPGITKIVFRHQYSFKKRFSKMVKMLVVNNIYRVECTPAPGTERKLHTAGSLYKQRLSAVLFAGNGAIIHSNFIIHSIFIQK